MRTVLLPSLAAKRSVPSLVVKSQRSEAVPFTTSQPMKPASAAVAYSTEAGALVLPVRMTVTETLPAPSPAL